MLPRLVTNLHLQNLMVVFTFSILEWKNSFRANFVLNIVSLSGSLVPKPVRICTVYWRCSVFLFQTENTILDKFSHEKVKIVSLSQTLVSKLPWTCRIQWWCSLFLKRETPFSGKFGPKKRKGHFQLEFSSKNYSNMQNSMVVFTFSVLEWKHYFWANLVQNINIVSFSWNLAPSLIGISEIQGWRSLFQFYTGNTLFGQILSKSALLTV